MTAIAQAIFEDDQPRVHSQGFADDQVAAATVIAQDYGRGATIEALFVVALGRNHVAVVQAFGARMRFLAVPAELYKFIGDPFVISQRFPANFADAGPLVDLEWDVVTPNRRSIEELRAILKSDDGPALLGAVQALVEGARVVFVRTQPDAATLQRLWQLLPDSTRGELRVATFAPNNALGFDLMVAPQAEPPCVTDEQASEYPQGKYELHLQIAIEAGDERELAQLFSRRSPRQALRLMFRILVAAAVISLVIRVIGW